METAAAFGGSGRDRSNVSVEVTLMTKIRRHAYKHINHKRVIRIIMYPLLFYPRMLLLNYRREIGRRRKRLTLLETGASTISQLR